MLVTRMSWAVIINDIPVSSGLMPRIEFSILGRAVMNDIRGIIYEQPIPRNWYFVILPCK